MDLRSWLEAKAGLSGRPLEVAVKACQTNFVETVDDLRLASQTESEFKELFTQIGLRTKISAAFNALCDPTSSLSISTGNKTAAIISFEYACHWTTTKMETSVAAVKLSEVTGDEQMVFHFTSLQAARLITRMGFRMSPSGQGGGGVYFTKLNPAQYKYGQTPFKRLALIDCYGEEHLETYATAPNFQAVLVCSVKTALLKPVPGGRDNAVMVPRTLMTAMEKPDSDGYYYLQPNVVKRAFQLEDEEAGIFHAVTSADLDVGEQFVLQVHSRYKSIEEAWIAFDVKKKNVLSRSDFKRVVHANLGIVCTDEQRKQLRHQLDPQNLKVVTFEALADFLVDKQNDKKSTNSKQGKRKDEKSTALCVLPMDVPSLPDSFRPRVKVESQLKAKLLDRESTPCVTAQGMGGVGKSVITSAVVRSEEIRERFRDGIAWIGMNQNPLLLALQQRCFFQLTKDQLPLKYRTSVEDQHACLSEALISKTCLIVLDDCWSKQHAKCFNVIDTASPSKLLISTRIAGLLKTSSSEIKLALMTNEEAIDLLAHGAGLDFEEVPNAVAEVVALCGRLPLCLNIAASIILDHGDNWQEEVVPEMRKGFSQLVTGDEEDTKELSIQDSVIVASLASIVGKDADRVKRMFISSAVFGEDQRIPCPLFVTLWVATVKASAKAMNKKAMKHKISIREAKRMVGVLVRRSLFLELVRGSIQLHDIVRDYILARVEKERELTGGLQLLQRSFVSEFLESREQWEDVAAGSTIPRGKEHDWFLGSGALQWHMQQAWTRPLMKDELACSWLLQTEERIVSCAVKAIPLEAQVKLASDLARAGELEKAIRVLHNVTESREMPLSELQANAKQLFNYVDSIPLNERSETIIKYDATAAYKMLTPSDKASEDATLAFSRLMAALDQGASLGHFTTAKVLNYKACELIGFLPSLPNPSKSEFDEGGQMNRRAASEFEAAIFVGEISNPLEAYNRKFFNCLHSFHWLPADYWTQPLDAKEIGRVQMAELTKAAADYEYDINHPYKRVVSSKMDTFLENTNVLALLALWWCDERGVADYLAKWEDGELRAIAEGDNLNYEYFSTVSVLRVISAVDSLWRIFSAVGMSWHEADHFQFVAISNLHGFSWMLPDGESFCLHPEVYRMVAKLNSFLCAPDDVETSEVLTYLPQADSCRWVRDRADHTIGSTEPLEVLISQVALVCGDSSVCFDLAARHAKAAAAQHFMPQKVMHAQAALGSAMMSRQRAGSSTRDISEETLAVLDVALKSAKKMRLQKYADLIDETTGLYRQVDQ